MSAAPGGPKPAIDETVTASLRCRLAPNGRDVRLLDRQLPLTAETHAVLYGEPAAVPAYQGGSLPQLERAAAALTGDARPGLGVAAALSRALARLAPREIDRQDRAVSAVLAAGAATPLERARALATLAHVSGIAARVCLLYREAAPNFHAVAELRVMDSWSVFDPLAGQFYLITHHPYASAWDIMRRPAIADSHPDHGRKPTVDASFYRTVCISSVEPQD